MKLTRSNKGPSHNRIYWLFLAVIGIPILSMSKPFVQWASDASQLSLLDITQEFGADADSSKGLVYPIKDQAKRSQSGGFKNNIDLNDPSVKTYFEYNPTTQTYDEYKEVAGKKTLVKRLSRDEYLAETAKQEQKRYFDQRAKSNAGEAGFITTKPQVWLKPQRCLINSSEAAWLTFDLVALQN